MTTAREVQRGRARSVRVGGGNRTRSMAALARYNARVALESSAEARSALQALLDPGNGFGALTGDLLEVLPGDDHARCRALTSHVTSVSDRGRYLVAPAIAEVLGRSGIPQDLSLVLADFIEVATVPTGARTFGDAPIDGLLHVLPVLVCHDLHDCPSRFLVVASLRRREVAALLLEMHAPDAA